MTPALAATARHQAGAFSLRQAVRAGMTPSAVRRRVTAGAWEEVAPQVYCPTGSPPSPMFPVWVAALACGGGPYAITGRAALLAYGLFAGPIRPVDVAVPASRRLPESPLVLPYRTPRWTDLERVVRDGIALVSAADAILHTAADLPQAAVLGLVQRAVFHGHPTPA